MPETTVTNYDFSPEACVERLRKLLAEPPLKLSAEGSGIPGSPYVLTFDGALVIARDEVEQVVRHLSGNDTTTLRDALIEAWQALEMRPEPWACELYRRLSAVLLDHTAKAAAPKLVEESVRKSGKGDACFYCGGTGPCECYCN